MLNPVVICHQLRSPENLASIARSMANFGFTDLILSDPQTHEFRAAGRMAVKADTVMDKFQVALSLDEALTGVVYAVGSTSRTQLKRQTPLTPEQAVARLATHSARGKVALVLGGEKRGLSDDELERCQDVLVIPTPGPQPSMNLSHAATVLFYLCSRHDAPPPAETPGASLGMLKRLEDKMKQTLLVAEYLNPQAPEHVLSELTRALVRGHITEREAQIWFAAFEHLYRLSPSSASR